MITHELRPMVKPPLIKFRFRWRANKASNYTLVEAPSYPEACYWLALYHKTKVFRRGKVPKDFELDLSSPEIVE